MAFITITGNLTKDAQLKSTNDGSPFCSFGIADNYGKDQVQFFNCTLWGSRAEKIAQYLKKGTKATVIGRMNIVKGKDGHDPSMMVSIYDLSFGGSQSENNEQQKPQKDSVDKVESEFDDEIPF